MYGVFDLDCSTESDLCICINQLSLHDGTHGLEKLSIGHHELLLVAGENLIFPWLVGALETESREGDGLLFFLLNQREGLVG